MAIRVKSQGNIGNIKASINTEEPKLVNTEDELSTLDFKFNEYYDPNKLKSFIKKVERMIRSSSAYSSYIGNLRNEKDLDRCAILGNITDDDADIEFHHYPFSLYDICRIVIMDKIIKEIPFTSFDICIEVMNLHSMNLIGLVPLCVTEHQLVNDGVRFIPLYSAYGKINDFINKYSDSIDDELIEKYNELVKMTNKLKEQS